MSDEKLIETASAGSTGAGAIASTMGQSRHAEHQWRSSVESDRAKRKEEEEKVKNDMARSSHNQEQLKKARAIAAARKKRSFSSFFKRKVNEELDLGSIVSQLKGIENEQTDKTSNLVSYGIEDDKGNFMRVTVVADQAQEFEMEIARRMADNEENASLNLGKKSSLAEILFDLQNQFDIRDVEFPIIPKDAVYNAGDATVGQAPVPSQSGIAPQTDELGMGDGMDAGMDDMSATGDMSGNPNDTGRGDSDLGDSDTGEMGDTGMTGDEDMDMEMDAGNVEPFGDESTSSSDPSSLLKSLVDMLKKQAEAETAKANAAAEQSRATQAEWSAIAADKEVQRQEELARVEADVQEKKRREKMAKQYAEIAKYNVTQGKGALNRMGESEEDSFLYSALLEMQLDNPASLQKEKQAIVQKYRTEPGDDQLTKQYKTSAMQLEIAAINSRIKLAKLTADYNSKKNNQQQQPQNPQQQPQQQQPQNPQQQPQQQQPQNNGGVQ